MKIKDGFLKREVAGERVVIPLTTDQNTFGGMLRLNETGDFLWELLAEDRDRASLLSALLAEYDVAEEIAARDLDAFLDRLRQHGILAE